MKIISIIDKQVSRGANDMMVAGKIEGLQGGISNQVNFSKLPVRGNSPKVVTS